nr:MAG TPA: hypothetical protein [Caudoviricetes sp.]
MQRICRKSTRNPTVAITAVTRVICPETHNLNPGRQWRPFLLPEVGEEAC